MTRMTFRPRVATAVLLPILAGVLLVGCDESPSPQVPGDDASTWSIDATDDAPAETIETTVTRVIDGDTFAVMPVDQKLDTTGEHDSAPEHIVRLLGIDAASMHSEDDEQPECGAPQATDHLAILLPVGTHVTLTVDDAVGDQSVDGEGTQAYVATTKDDDIALEQVADGYAMPWHPDDKDQPARVALYRAAADTAVSQRSGVHQVCESIGRG